MNIADGIWPTMITPFTEKNEIDYEALERLIEWYIEQGVHGLFAVCQSSEMFLLTLEERVELAAFVKAKAAGRVPVIASGHISDTFEDQVNEINRMVYTGIDAMVLITNRLAGEHESDEVLWSNLERLMAAIPTDVPLGFYECPYPYKRLISPEILRRCSATERFLFLKDTSCDVSQIQAKLAAIQGTGLKIYNANSATLYETLKLGVSGYSGVMANFHPDLYVRLMNKAFAAGEQAAELADFLSLSSLIEKQLYPVNAKYYLMLEGVLRNEYCRSKNHAEFTPTNRLEVAQLHRMSKRYRD
ncbi:dihydrodipicolinate synthase family protein [Paenibacillus sp. MAHUQ-63]|nr:MULTISPECIES: dihydrodipicolinate synthase family protein [Bacillales]MDD9267139.1 dihydrodipicolinate synthase family protein [Paenibacillus sp. MAHUQ-63]